MDGRFLKNGKGGDKMKNAKIKLIKTYRPKKKEIKTANNFLLIGLVVVVLALILIILKWSEKNFHYYFF